MKVLIVDDSYNDRQMLRQTVAAHRHEPLLAVDGEEGLQMAQGHRPDLIISDVLMPGVDGFHFLRNLRALGSSIPFIFYSAVYGGIKDVELAHSLGADAFLVKPKDPVELWGEIEALLEKRSKAPSPAHEPANGNAEYLRKYSEVVATKLEEKVHEQEATLAQLEATLAERMRVEKALTESEKRYRQLLDSVTDYIYTVEIRDGRPAATFHGPGCITVTGYRSEEYLADPGLWLRMVYEEDRDLVTEQAAAILSGGAPFPLEHRIVHRDGRIRWVRNTPVPHYDTGGQLTAYDGLIADITERKQVEEESRTILKTALDGFLLVDLAGRILEVNDSYCQMTGYSREELVRREVAELDSVETPEEVRRRIERVREQGAARFEARHRRRDGSLIDVEVSVKYLPDKGGRMVSFLRDVTEKRKLEGELFQAKRLEIIGQLAGGVAHEVRNPLNAILSISEALFREKEIAGNPEFLPYIGHIRAQIGRLSKLMNDLLDLGKPIKESNIAPVSLQKICSDSLELWKNTEPAQRHRVSLALPRQRLAVLADDARLQQVLLNLLDNAAQNSPDGSEVAVTVGREGDRVVVRIADAGKGIPADRIDRVFEPFYTTRRTGTGLGLSLVKHLVESMGGEARIVNNDPPPGCSAEIVLVRAGRKG